MIYGVSTGNALYSRNTYRNENLELRFLKYLSDSPLQADRCVRCTTAVVGVIRLLLFPPTSTGTSLSVLLSYAYYEGTGSALTNHSMPMKRPEPNYLVLTLGRRISGRLTPQRLHAARVANSLSRIRMVDTCSAAPCCTTL